MVDKLSIQSAAISALQNLGRTSFSEDGFTQGQINAISDAIADAIEAYDEQNHSERS